MKALETLRHWFAVTDSLHCKFFASRARYQCALLTGNGQVLPVKSVVFRKLANAEWWVHSWAPRLNAIAPMSEGSRWIVVDLP
jgi:hypothetical protein